MQHLISVRGGSMRPKQETFAEAGFERYRKATRREQFLAEMDWVMPWQKLTALIEPVYPSGEGAGRPPVGLERMLRIHFLQPCFNLADPAVEEALYDSRSMREFVGIDMGREPVPDETTICKFRHRLEAHALGKQVLATVNAQLATQGFEVTTGTIVDATIRCRRAAQEPVQIDGACQGRASVPGAQTNLWLRQGALSGHRQERRASVCGLCPGEYLSTAPAADPAGDVVTVKSAMNRQSAAQKPCDERKISPLRCFA
jgi:IS5 family transposase